MPMLRKLFNVIGGMVATAILAVFGSYFSTLFAMAISSNIVARNEMPDNVFPFFIGGIFAFYLGMLWKKFLMSE